MIPNEKELLGNMVNEDKNLSAVHVNTPYANAEEYMDINYRLLRAESFYAIQKGIKDLLKV